jgi:putative transposase
MTKKDKSNTCVYNIAYHIIWCPKYRRKILTGDVERRLKYSLYLKSESMGLKIEQMEVMPDHIHLFVKSKLYLPPRDVVKGLKGYSSYFLRKEFPNLKWKDKLWSRSYYIETIGGISEKIIRKYIINQKKK